MLNFELTPAVRNLLLANLFFFLVQQYLPGFHLAEWGSLYPLGSPYFYPCQFVTYMFLHANWGHIFGNMLWLIIYGPMLEQRWGMQRFLTFWLICGIGAGVLYEGVKFYEIHRMEQAAVSFHQHPTGGDFAEFYRVNFPDASGYETLARNLQQQPHNRDIIAVATQAVDAAANEAKNSPMAGMLGASGAVFGIMLAFGYLFPNTERYFFPLPFPIKAKYLVAFSIVTELYASTHRTPGDNVAHYAHLGGALVGFIVIKLWERGRRQFY